MVALPRYAEPTVTDVDLNAADHTPIAARFYAPANARGAVLIVPAMGVPQSFYAPLATWLAREGFHAVTFDYRGTFASRRGPMAAYADADILTWAEQDTAAVMRALAVRAPGLPITWLGHSLGGQIVPFVAEHFAVSKIVTIATGSGYWRENAAPLRRKVWLLWFLVVPLATPLFGYFPGKALGMVGDLPAGVIRQWRRWCLHPDYAAGDGDATRELYGGVVTPITSLSFTDDDMMSDANTTAIHSLYTRAPRKMLRLSPGDAGVKRIGHFGFFRKEMQEPLWEGLLRAELATR